jgi:hypothetical protein
VTAFRAQFHYNAAENRLWNIAEWTFFLDHVRDQVLKPGGRLALKLNPQEHKRGKSMSGQGGLNRHDDVLLRFMADRGATPLGKSGLQFTPLR